LIGKVREIDKRAPLVRRPLTFGHEVEKITLLS
jgi:hypothetical protein